LIAQAPGSADAILPRTPTYPEKPGPPSRPGMRTRMDSTTKLYQIQAGIGQGGHDLRGSRTAVTPTQLFPSTEDPHKHWISLSLSSRFTVTSTVKKRTLLPAREMDSVWRAATPAHQSSTIAENRQARLF